MRQLYHTTELIGIKDKNITLTKVFSTRDTYRSAGYTSLHTT